MHSRPNSQGGCIYSLAGLAAAPCASTRPLPVNVVVHATLKFAGSIFKIEALGDAKHVPKLR